MNVRNKVLTAVTDHAMLSADSTVIVGLSGGADSVTLLHVLHSLREETLIADIVAVHVDHQLRGEESQRDRLFCEELCAKWNIPCHVVTYDVKALAEAEGKGIEEMGRELRYQAFSEVASRFPCSRIATAHTADDNAETLLLHLCRGCGVHGLAGIPVVRDTIIRPLIDCSREEIEQYCREQNLLYVADSTNADVSYARNRVRHEILPLLHHINPSVKKSLTRLAKQMQKTDAYLQRQADPYWFAMQTGQAGVYHRTPLEEADEALQPLLFMKMLDQLHIPIDEHHLRQLGDCLHTGASLSLPHDYGFAAYKTFVYISKMKDHQAETVKKTPISIDSPFLFGGEMYRVLRLTREDYEQKLNICNLVFKNACDYDMIRGDLFLRKRQEGDCYHPAGRACGKSLKNLFNEAAIYAPYRDNVPVFCDEHGIVMVYGFGCDERVRITEKTQHILLVEKTEE